MNRATSGDLTQRPAGDTAAGLPASPHPAILSRSHAEDALQNDLVDRIVRRDEDALAKLYELLIGRVYGLALRMTRDVGLAEEVAEDVFWQIWRQAPRFDSRRGTAVTWVMTIAHSRALDALRSILPVQLEADMTFLANAANEDQDGCDEPQNLLAATQREQCVHRALADLEPLQRQLVALAFFRGLTHEEISTHTCLPLGTVKSHLRRALVRLRQVLEPELQNKVIPHEA